MPELMDQDDTYYYVKPDDGGQPFPIAKQAGSPEDLGISAPGSAPQGSEIGALRDGIMQAPQEPVSSGLDVTAIPPTDIAQPGGPTTTPAVPPPDIPGDVGPVGSDASAPSVGAVPPPGVVPETSPVVPATGPIGPSGTATPELHPSSMPITTPQAQTPTQPPVAPPPPSEVQKAEKDKLASMRETQKANDELFKIANEQSMTKTIAMAADSIAANRFANEQAEKNRIVADKLKTEHLNLDRLRQTKRDHKSDPDHVWKEKGVGAQIVAILARGLGAFGAAMNGGPNYAGEALDALVNRDIAAQKDELLKKGEDVDTQRNLIASIQKEGFDEAQQDHVAYILQMDAAKRKLDSMLSANSPDVLKQQAKILHEQINQNIDNEIQRYDAASKPKALTFGDQMMLERLKMEMGKQQNDLRLPFLGPNKYALNEPSAKRVTEAYQAHQEFLTPVNELKTLLGKYGTQAFGDHSADMQQLGLMIQNKLRKSDEMGTLDKGSQDMLEQIAKDPTSLVHSGDKVKRLYENLERMSAKKFAATLKGAGLNDDASLVERSAPQFKSE